MLKLFCLYLLYPVSISCLFTVSHIFCAAHHLLTFQNVSKLTDQDKIIIVIFETTQKIYLDIFGSETPCISHTGSHPCMFIWVESFSTTVPSLHLTSLLCTVRQFFCSSLIPFVCKWTITWRQVNIEVRFREKKEQPLSAGVCSVQIQYIDPCWLCAVSQEIAEELGLLSSDSSEEEVLTTRVVRRRVIIQVNKHVAAVQPQCTVECCRVSG